MASSQTLATLRARVLEQVTAADPGIDYTPVTASAMTLTTMRDRVEIVLQDSGNATWAAGDIDEGITQAIEQYSRRRPQHAVGVITLAADGREISLSTLTGLVRVERVWCPYDVSDPTHPPNWVHFQTWPGSLIYIDDPTEPSNGDVVRVFYTKEHTLNGLEGAGTTTFPVDDDSFLIDGAAAFAARFRAVEIAEQATVDRDVFKRLTDWATTMMKEFTEGLRQRYTRGSAFTYDQNDVDEAIRWALHRYSQVRPDQTVTSVTLAAGGREVDISSITDYWNVARVWWPYTAASPEYPPKWRDFELWPGDVLYINDPDEPQSGDVVRVWYTRVHKLNGLDSATATTIPVSAETVIVVGASGFAAQERVQDESSRFVPRKLREWASARLREFEGALRAASRRQAAQHSGIAPMPLLDRWDDDQGWS